MACCRYQISFDFAIMLSSFQIRKKRFILGDMLNIANLVNVDILGTNIRPTNFILLRVKVSIADSPLPVLATHLKNGGYWKHMTTHSMEDADLKKLKAPLYQCRAPPCSKPSRILHRAKRTIPFDISPFSLLKVLVLVKGWLKQQLAPSP